MPNFRNKYGGGFLNAYVIAKFRMFLTESQSFSFTESFSEFIPLNFSDFYIIFMYSG